MLLLSLRRCCGSLDSHSPWRPRRTASDRRSLMARACRRVSRSHRVHPLPPTADPCNNDTGGACGRPSGGRLESVHVQPFCALALDIPVRGPHSAKGHAVARLWLTDTRDWTVRVYLACAWLGAHQTHKTTDLAAALRYTLSGGQVHSEHGYSRPIRHSMTVHRLPAVLLLQLKVRARTPCNVCRVCAPRGRCTCARAPASLAWCGAVLLPSALLWWTATRRSCRRPCR